MPATSGAFSKLDLRARAGLASTLLQLGDVDGALAHYRDILKLDPIAKGTADSFETAKAAALFRRGAAS